jgi:formate dehydrogenase subunit beta
MPRDVLLFHTTRMAHMVASCVGCGQCEDVCPRDIPLGSLFPVVAARVQELFEYVPGRSLEEQPPLMTFKEEELSPL